MEVKCSAPIIEIKDRVHQDWFELQSYPHKLRVLEDTLLQKDYTDRIMTKARHAHAKARECEAAPALVDHLGRLLARAETKINTWPTTDYLQVKYYSVAPEVATDFLIGDINKIANAIHKIGYSFLETIGSYAGCQVLRGTHLSEVNRAALSYCEGISGKPGTLFNEGVTVEHKLGVHSNVINFTEAEEGYDVDITYTESGDDNWELRQDEILHHLQQQYKLDCQSNTELERLVAKCTGNIADHSKIREMAYFFSALKDVDLLSSDCIDAAMEYAKAEARDTAAQLGDSAYKRPPYPADRREWEREVCGIDEEKRLREKVDILETEITGIQESAQIRRNQAVRAPCTLEPYYNMAKAIEKKAIINTLCRDLGNLDQPTTWCLNIAEQEELANEQAARDLVARCQPEPIIRKLEAENTGGTLANLLDMISQSCSRAEAKNCLDEINAALERDRRGEKPLTLQLEAQS